MKKVAVNWPIHEHGCPKPQAKFPALQTGSLVFPKRSSFYGSVPTGTPCQPPAPRPPPVSLRPRADRPSVVSPVQEPVLTKVQQRSLVLPTALPLTSAENHGGTSRPLCNIGMQPSKLLRPGLGIWSVPLDLPPGFVGNFQHRKRFLSDSSAVVSHRPINIGPLLSSYCNYLDLDEALRHRLAGPESTVSGWDLTSGQRCF